MQVSLPIKNYPKQESIFQSSAPFVLIKKGRRAGFTRGAANNTIKEFLAGRKKKGLWVDVVNSNIEKYVERFFIPSLRLLPEHLWKWQKQQKILRIRDSIMDFKSVDNPYSMEGFGYDYMILNESGIILKDTYLWENAILPMTWDSNCQVFIGGTPKGGGGVFEELYKRGLDKEQEEYQSFYINGFDNPYVPDWKIKRDMEKMTQRAIDQEVYGEFLDDTGVVFRGVRAIAILNPQGQEPIPGHIYVVGADLAKLEDFTVLTVYDRKTNHQVCQMRFNQLEWPFIQEKIKAVSDKYNKALVILDSTGVGEPIFDLLVRASVPVEPVKFTNTIKKQLVEKLANWIELKHLYMLQLDETVNELTSFTYDFSEKTDRVYYGAPPGFHDDIVISHALACWALQPLVIQRPEPEMTVIQRDLHDKRHRQFDSDSYDPTAYYTE